MKQFWEDKSKADIIEEFVAKVLKEKYKYETIEFNHDNKYDLKCTLLKKETTYEVKCDSTCQKTGNIGIEFFNRGKDSGISVSEAQFYVFHIPNGNQSITLKIPTNKLKELIKLKRYIRIVHCGDDRLAQCYIFKFDEIYKHSTVLDKRQTKI